MNFSKNTLTGNMEANLGGKLISISSEVRTNKNGTDYRLANIEIVKADGKKAVVTSIVYEKNFSYGMQVGQTYLTTATLTPNGPSPVLFTTSHLPANEVITAEDLGFIAVNAENVDAGKVTA
jgi:hypothetical protein